MAKDPVCGMYVDENNAAYRADVRGTTYYFCSETCMKSFLEPEKEFDRLKILLLISIALSILTLIFTYNPVQVISNNLILFLLATPVQFFIGWRFYKGAWDALKARTANMDTLIALGTSATWLYSTLVTFLPQIFTGEVYFDASVMIITLVLLGKLLEEMAKNRATESLRKLMNMQPNMATILKLGNEVQVPIEEVNVDDILLVKSGEVIPIDGIVKEGYSSVDESMLTGESMPITKKTGDEVMGGTINKSGLLKIQAAKIGSSTTLAQIISLVEKAQLSKVPMQKLADKISSIFVPTVIAISILSFLIWLFVDKNPVFALMIAISILIVACPCALGLATPIAILVATSKAAENGILIKSGEVLENAQKINTVLLDKTGTLTKGEPNITNLFGVGDVSDKEILTFAGAAEKGSNHPMAQAIVRKVKEMKIRVPDAERYEEIPGNGMKVSFLRKQLLVGNKELMEQFGIPIGVVEKQVERLENEGRTAVIVCYDKKLLGVIGVADTLKETSKSAIERLEKMGIEVVMITGDNERTAENIARQLGIEKVFANVLPKQKAEIVRGLQEEKKVVAFVGDGVNDAPALAQADVGIAIGSGTDVAKETGHIVLIKSDLNDVVTAIDLSKYAVGKIKQNLFWAFFYNILGIPIAAGLLYPYFGVLLTPAFAGAAMSFSSVFVVINSVLMKGYKPKR
jgi:Cu+-exporting ATPase